MEANAARVWANRRSDGIMGYSWNAAAPAFGIEAQYAAGGVSLLNLLALPTVDIRPKSARFQRHPGAAMAISIPSDGSAATWLFGLSAGNAGGDSEQGVSGLLRRLDGRVQPLQPSAIR